MPTQFKLVVSSPCQGNQVVNQQGDTMYVGADGDFAYAVLYLPSGESRWEFTVYDTQRTTACTPTRTFRQDTPGNASDPTGDYTDSGGSGAGQVEAYP